MDGQIVIDIDQKKIDEEKSDAKITIEIIKEVANKINPMVQLTVDTPCNYEDRKLPILDVKTSMYRKEILKSALKFYISMIEDDINNKKP